MPKKLAISRKFEKKPMYLTFAGTQRMSSSSTNRIAKLVRNSRTGLRPKMVLWPGLLGAAGSPADRVSAEAVT